MGRGKTVAEVVKNWRHSWGQVKGDGGKAGESARRLASVLNQFDVKWDLFAMPWKDLMTKLPKEFPRFLPEES